MEWYTQLLNTGLIVTCVTYLEQKLSNLLRWVHV